MCVCVCVCVCVRVCVCVCVCAHVFVLCLFSYLLFELLCVLVIVNVVFHLRFPQSVNVVAVYIFEFCTAHPALFLCCRFVLDKLFHYSYSSCYSD